MPYLQWILLSNILVRVLLLLASVKWPRVTKIFFLHYIVTLCIENTLPQDYGKFQMQLAIAWSSTYYFCFATSYWLNVLSALAMTSYIQFVVEPFIWQESAQVTVWFARILD